MVAELIFDLETKRLFNEINTNNPADLGISLVSCYFRRLDLNSLQELAGKMHSFWERELDKMWPLWQEADRIIGFNSLGFDVPALQPHALYDIAASNHFDILQKIKEVLGHRLSLNVLARDTLGRGKIDVGVRAVQYWRQQDKKSLAKLRQYCEDDVILTRDIYDYGLKNNKLRYKDKWNTLRTVEVDFSYSPEELKAGKQIGLF